MDMNTYKLFVLVAKTKSISRTAKLTGYTQSSISHTITRFEKEIGIKLFIRDRYGVYLSQTGNELFPKVLKLLSYNEELKQFVYDIKGLEVGTINIGTFSSISIHWLPSILNQFQKEHPHIQINLCEGSKDNLYQWILDRHVDLAFYDGSENINIEFFPIKQDEFLAIFPKDYPLDSSLTVYPISNFNGKPFILFKAALDPAVQQLLNKSNVTPHIRFSSMDDYAIMSMVEHRLGLSILPELIIGQRKEYLKTLPLNPHYFRNLGIGIKSLDHASPATKKFVNFALNYFHIPNCTT